MVVVWDCSRDSGWRREQREKLKEYAAWKAESEARAEEEKRKLRVEEMNKKEEEQWYNVSCQRKREENFLKHYKTLIDLKLKNKDYTISNIPIDNDFNVYLENLSAEFNSFLLKNIKDLKQKVYISVGYKIFLSWMERMPGTRYLFFLYKTFLNETWYASKLDIITSKFREKFYIHSWKIQCINNLYEKDELSMVDNIAIEKTFDDFFIGCDCVNDCNNTEIKYLFFNE